MLVAGYYRSITSLKLSAVGCCWSFHNVHPVVMSFGKGCSVDIQQKAASHTLLGFFCTTQQQPIECFEPSWFGATGWCQWWLFLFEDRRSLPWHQPFCNNGISRAGRVVQLLQSCEQQFFLFHPYTLSQHFAPFHFSEMLWYFKQLRLSSMHESFCTSPAPLSLQYFLIVHLHSTPSVSPLVSSHFCHFSRQYVQIVLSDGHFFET